MVRAHRELGGTMMMPPPEGELAGEINPGKKEQQQREQSLDLPTTAEVRQVISKDREAGVLAKALDKLKAAYGVLEGIHAADTLYKKLQKLAQQVTFEGELPADGRLSDFTDHAIEISYKDEITGEEKTGKFQLMVEYDRSSYSLVPDNEAARRIAGWS